MNYDKGKQELKEVMEKRNIEISKHRDYKQKIEEE
jgi:hypothetical protein